jgi:hypothetical protein
MEPGKVPRSQEHVIGDVLEECGVQSGCFIKGERRHQTGFGAARRRSLGHEGDTTRRDFGLFRVAVQNRLAANTIRTIHALPP